MTTFVNAHFSTTHGGVERAEAAVAAVGRMRQGFDGTRSIAALLLAAVVAGLLVVMAVVRARLAVAHNRSTPTTKASPLWSTRWETRQPRLAVAV